MHLIHHRLPKMTHLQKKVSNVKNWFSSLWLSRIFTILSFSPRLKKNEENITIKSMMLATRARPQCASGCARQVYAGSDSTGQPLTSSPVCGNTPPEPLVSSSNEIFIEFVSNPQFAGSRFLLSWEWLSQLPEPGDIIGTG